MGSHPGEVGVCSEHGVFDEFCGQCVDKELMEAANEREKILTAEDKLTIRTLEVEAYRIQATQQQVNEQMKAAVEALNAGIRAVAEKLGYDQKEYRLDLKTMEFVRVGSGDVTAQ
jgi:hypothetical protein